jgi:A/G-specific adenine glycosylase
LQKPTTKRVKNTEACLSSSAEFSSCLRLLRDSIRCVIRSEFRHHLLRWYGKNGRDLPWRQARDPYAVLVSEFMLQQTHVVTVLPYYKDWLRRFPSLAELADASENDVLHAWQGLGYYARARNLHATARLITNQYRRHFPRVIVKLQKLPGVGKYTAHAIATFAFDQAVPIVEANVSRVLSRVFDLRKPIDSTNGRNALWNYAASLVPKRSAARYNSALLDLGALICLPRNPKCGICPVKNLCRAKDPELLPIKRCQPAIRRLIERHALIVRQHKILLQPAEHRWRGMWILPQLNGGSRMNGAIHESVFPFTNHRITLQVFPAQSHKIDKRRAHWFSRRRLQSIPIPSPHRRAIEQLLANA